MNTSENIKRTKTIEQIFKNINIIDFNDFILKQKENSYYLNNDLYFDVHLYSKSLSKIIITSFEKEEFGIEVLILYKNNKNTWKNKNFYHYDNIDKKIINKFLNKNTWKNGVFKIKRTLIFLGFSF